MKTMGGTHAYIFIVSLGKHACGLRNFLCKKSTVYVVGQVDLHVQLIVPVGNNSKCLRFVVIAVGSIGRGRHRDRSMDLVSTGI